MSAEYRHEYKYCINAAQAALLECRARAVLTPDPHAGPLGSYVIRSLYFDTPYDSCYYESEDGYDRREKYRIRLYNSHTDFLRLEKKSKQNGMTKKESCVITQEQCKSFMEGRVPPITETMSAVQKKLFLEMEHKAMLPKVIVIYERIPYIHPVGNVRITFDRALASASDVMRFLDEEIPVERPVFPAGESLMEVKWDELLPDHISRHMALDSLQWTSFSKYYLCRKYHCYGGA